MTFKVTRNIRNELQALSVFPIEGKIDGKPAEMHITTMKRSNGMLTTNAHVYIIEDANSITHRFFHDFSEFLYTAKLRVTEKAIATQHEGCIKAHAAVMERVIAHYKKLGELA